ncbi:hypothetical protein AAG570_013659 [Ranatra chinensis]|uniref:Uncharacterized protein n=1 Tax=Ranatra chinensis TaxID=642074 RepID=A0ABD0YZ57_9HEMI
MASKRRNTRVANVVGRDDTSSTSSSTSDSVVGGVGRIRPQIVGVAAPRPRVEPQPTNDKSFVVLQDDNNNYYRRKTLEPVSTAWEPAPTVWEPPAGGCGTSRWLKNNRRGSSRPWTPSWAQPT